MALQLERRLFTVDEYHKMVAAGILTEDDRIELIEGEIVRMSPIGKHHAGIVNRIAALFHKLYAESAVVAVQNPILVSEITEPEPDVTVLKFRDDYYAGKLPVSDDILVLVEVADTSVESDRNAKLPLYARAGIAEVWIANLPEDTVETYSNPKADVYRQTRIARRGESLTLPGIPSGSLRVEDVLGGPTA